MPVSPFATEAWTEYALGICVLVARILCRINMVGMKWDGDDYFAVLAIILWTAELCMMHLIEIHGSIKGLNDETVLTLTDEEKRSIVFGTKCIMAAWCTYVSLIWTLKACMLFLYGRLTLDLKQRQMVKIAAVASVAAYISLMVVIWSHCTPVHKKWQIYPYPGDTCALGTPMHYSLLVTNVRLAFCFSPPPQEQRVKTYTFQHRPGDCGYPVTTALEGPNATAQAGLPRHRLEWGLIDAYRKLLCGIWLCTGGFIIVATIVRCILCLQNVASTSVSIIWSLRETFIGIIAVNTPIIGPWIARNARRLPVIYARDGSTNSDVGGVSGPQPGGHKLSRLERRAKENRARRGLGWTTIHSVSQEDVVIEELELHLTSQTPSELSGRTAMGPEDLQDMHNEGF